MVFKLYDCDIGFKYNGVDYAFDHVAEVQIEDPERNRLTRGANAKDNIGLAYKDGLKDPKRVTIPIMAMTPALVAVFNEVYYKQGRIDWYCVARSDGSSKWAKNAVLSNRPQQLTLDETAESMNVSVEMETFELTENHKS